MLIVCKKAICQRKPVDKFKYLLESNLLAWAWKWAEGDSGEEHLPVNTMTLCAQDNVCIRTCGCGVLDCSGHGSTRDQTACVVLRFGTANFFNAAVLQTPFQGKETHAQARQRTLMFRWHKLFVFVAVVLANFVLWNWTTVCLRLADPEDHVWLKCSRMAGKSGRGTYIWTVNSHRLSIWSKHLQFGLSKCLCFES